MLYQNDDAGRDFGDVNESICAGALECDDLRIDGGAANLVGFFGNDHLCRLVAEADLERREPLPKAAAQAIRKAHDIGWKPLHFLNSVSGSIQTVLAPAGLEKSVGLITGSYLRDQTDPQWADDPGVKEFYAFMKKHYPSGDPNDGLNSYAYSVAQTLVHVLKRCGDDLTRENVMKQAANIRDLALPMLDPGIKINTSATDYYPIQQMRLRKFDGKIWVPFGEIISD